MQIPRQTAETQIRPIEMGLICVKTAPPHFKTHLKTVFWRGFHAENFPVEKQPCLQLPFLVDCVHSSLPHSGCTELAVSHSIGLPAGLKLMGAGI